jgi:uncharacterized membrane protein
MDQSIANLLIAIYETENGAEDSLEKYKSSGKQELTSVQAAVAVIKDTNSGLKYKDVGLTPEVLSEASSWAVFWASSAAAWESC